MTDCSDAERIRAEIVTRCTDRGAAKTVCPSEIARVLFPECWRIRMDDVRAAARALVEAGRIEMTQGGTPVDPQTARGPIRLRLRPPDQIR